MGAHVDSVAVHALTMGTTGRGRYQSGIIGDDPGIVAGTEKRDVSDMLDLLALAETPFINRVGWGPDSGGVTIEWISEDLGPGYFYQLSGVGSGTYATIIVTSADGLESTEAKKQIQDGTILYHFSSADSEHALYAVHSVDADGTMILSAITTLGTTSTSGTTSINAGDKFYILGAVANEGSLPRDAKPRNRVVCSNAFNILRQDVQITGSAKETDMYVTGREDRHQILMRLKEMQRQRERMALYSHIVTKTSAVAGMMNGCFGWLIQNSPQSRPSTDTTTRSLTETALNTVVNDIWENGGGKQLTFYAPLAQIAKFTQWDKNRIRMRIDESKGGGHITSFITESGIILDLVPMAKAPSNIAFVINDSKVKLRAKQNRKAIMEKLGKAGDFDDWQILSEFSMEMKGWNLGQHGMFSSLA